MKIANLPDSHVLWSPETGPVTLGQIKKEVRAETPALDSRARTVKMWGWIATHPDAKPWLTRHHRPLDFGPSPAGSAGSTE